MRQLNNKLDYYKVDYVKRIPGGWVKRAACFMAEIDKSQKELAGILGIEDWLVYTVATKQYVSKHQRSTIQSSQAYEYRFDLCRIERYSGRVEMRSGKRWTRFFWSDTSSRFKDAADDLYSAT